MGHSKKVAKKHYLHVMADQYALAMDLDKEDKLSMEPDKTVPKPPAQESFLNENFK